MFCSKACPIKNISGAPSFATNSSKEDRKRTDDPNLHYYSKSRKNILITGILTLVLLCLLILPVFLLYRIAVEKNHDISYMLSIGILLVFTLTFSAILSLFTQAKRHEIFGAAAAYVSYLLDWTAVANNGSYCAVLVVFISNVPGASWQAHRTFFEVRGVDASSGTWDWQVLS